MRPIAALAGWAMMSACAEVRSLPNVRTGLRAAMTGSGTGLRWPVWGTQFQPDRPKAPDPVASANVRYQSA